VASWEGEIEILDIFLNDFIFWFLWLPLIFSISIIVVYKKENEKFTKALLIFLASYYIARSIIYIL